MKASNISIEKQENKFAATYDILDSNDEVVLKATTQFIPFSAVKSYVDIGEDEATAVDMAIADAINAKLASESKKEQVVTISSPAPELSSLDFDSDLSSKRAAVRSLHSEFASSLEDGDKERAQEILDGVIEVLGPDHPRVQKAKDQFNRLS